MGFWDGSGISWTICKQSAPRPGQVTTTTPHHSMFTGRMLFLAPNKQCQSTEGRGAEQQMALINKAVIDCSGVRRPDGTDRRTDRRTPDSCIDSAAHTKRAVPTMHE